MIDCAGERRFFIDITEAGCPCGCLYCYVKTIPHDEIVLGEDEIAKLPLQLMSNPKFVPGPYGTLLAFGAHCDLFRTSALFRRFLFALRVVAPLGNPIQVSTKQSISSEWAAQMAEVRAFSTQIVVFVSCSTIIRSTFYEPKAASPEDRFASFDVLRAYGIPTCLFIKPFLPSVTDNETRPFLQVIQTKLPDAVCVGVLYWNDRIAAHLQPDRFSMVKEAPNHPLMANSLGVTYPTPKFLVDLQTALSPTPILQNSACVVAYINGIPCPTHVWERCPKLCTKCQDCGSLVAASELPVPAKRWNRLLEGRTIPDGLARD